MQKQIVTHKQKPGIQHISKMIYFCSYEHIS